MVFQSRQSRLARAVLRLYARKYEKKPAPLDRVRLLRRLAGGERDALITPLSETTSIGKRLNNQYLAEVLANDVLGTWALDAETLNLLESEIRSRRPQAILEFGSGISTICFARYMQELHAQDDVISVYSIEQDRHYAEQLSARLVELGLDRVVSIIVAPLQEQVVEGAHTVCYQLPPGVELRFERHPEFIVIDGPAGEDGVRFGTLPLIKPYLQGDTAFFLDDALRDGELQTGLLWSNLPWVSLSGMYLCGKGLLVGCAHDD